MPSPSPEPEPGPPGGNGHRKAAHYREAMTSPRAVGDALGDLDATGAAALVRSGQVSPLELVDAAIARIEAADPMLNAVIHRRFEAAREEAAGPLPDGPFRGVPFLVKDMICHTAGDPCHEGMRFLRELDWRAKHDTPLPAPVKAAG